VNKWISGEWVIERTTAHRRRILHYWFTIIWFTAGTVVWIVLRDELWFVGFMSLYAIWVTHLAGWAAETPVEDEVVGTRPAAPPSGPLDPEQSDLAPGHSSSS